MLASRLTAGFRYTSTAIPGIRHADESSTVIRLIRSSQTALPMYGNSSFTLATLLCVPEQVALDSSAHHSRDLDLSVRNAILDPHEGRSFSAILGCAFVRHRDQGHDLSHLQAVRARLHAFFRCALWRSPSPLNKLQISLHSLIHILFTGTPQTRCKIEKLLSS